MIVLILQIVLLMLQRRVMGRRPTAHETGYARWHSRRDTWAIFKTEGRIMEAQFDAAMRPYSRQVLENSKWMILVYWITYICILTYNVLLEQAQAATTPADAPALVLMIHPPLLMFLPLLLLDMSTTHRNIPMWAPLIMEGAEGLPHPLISGQNNVGCGRY